jgi:hypothetical protein
MHLNGEESINPVIAQKILIAHYCRYLGCIMTVHSICPNARQWHGICYHLPLSSDRNLAGVANSTTYYVPGALTTDSQHQALHQRTTSLCKFLGDSHGKDGRRGLEDGERKRSQIR